MYCISYKDLVYPILVGSSLIQFEGVWELLGVRNTFAFLLFSPIFTVTFASLVILGFYLHIGEFFT